MSESLEKLQNRILSDAKHQSEETIKEAQAKSQQILEEARQRAQRESEDIIAKANVEAESIRRSILSSKVRVNRLRILDEKNRIVEDIIHSVEDQLSSISKSEQFEETAQRFVTEAVKAVDTDQPVVRIGFRDMSQRNLDEVSKVLPEGAKRYEALELQAKSSTIKSRLTILTTALNVSEATFENLDAPVNNIDALRRFLDEETGKLEHLVRELEAAEGKLQTEKEQASELSRFLSGLENVGVSLDAIAGRGFLTSLVGEAGPETIPLLQKDLDQITQGNLIFAITNTSEKSQTFLAIFPAAFQDDAKKMTTTLGAKLGPPWNGLPSDPKKAKEAIDLQLANLEKESKNLEETRTRIAREQGSRIIALGTLSEILDARTKALSGASTTEATLLLQAWIPEAKSSEIAQEISKTSGGLASMFVEKKKRTHSTEESAQAKDSEPPTLVKAPGWTQP